MERSLAPSRRPVGNVLVLTLGVAACCLATSPVRAQWTFVVLDPPGTNFSECRRIRDGQQVGNATFGSVPHAALWSGTAASFTDLHPAGQLQSQAFGVRAGRQVGNSYPLSFSHAGFWTGSAGSFVDLNPAGVTDSTAYDVAGNTMVGESSTGSYTSATLWNLASGSSTSLNPIGSSPPVTFSSISATDGLQQAGGVALAGTLHAALWSGTAASYVDLHPVAANSSYANDVHAGQQVGRAIFGFANHASLWTGSAASWVDLQPAAATLSEASGVHQGEQVGTSTVYGLYPHASLWSGSAASWVDLHNFVPAAYTASQAFGIWHDVLGTTYVVGSVTQSGHTIAAMWIRTAPVWTDVGFAKNGVNGAPHLGGIGPLTPNSLNSLPLTNATPSANSVFVIGVFGAYAPFLGGVLVPDPLIVLPLTIDPAGAVTFPLTVPAGLPAGLPVRFQHWIQDPVATFGFSASNGLLGILQ
ncbi:MAG TPA: hypothetical protein VFZ65_01385 [Planctomycetota bacterium]|nr:hypothetical protein [Planctomycetota bacterium]